MLTGDGHDVVEGMPVRLAAVTVRVDEPDTSVEWKLYGINHQTGMVTLRKNTYTAEYAYAKDVYVDGQAAALAVATALEEHGRGLIHQAKLIRSKALGRPHFTADPTKEARSADGG